MQLPPSGIESQVLSWAENRRAVRARFVTYSAKRFDAELTRGTGYAQFQQHGSVSQQPTLRDRLAVTIPPATQSDMSRVRHRDLKDI